MYNRNCSHCKHMFLCYIMLWIHFLNISSQGRRKSRWNKRIAEQNSGGVEAGALYGGENTSQVNENNILSGKPHFMEYGINFWFKQSWIVLWRAVSVLSITVYACKFTWKQNHLTSTSLKSIQILKTSDCTNTQQSFKCKQTKLSFMTLRQYCLLKRCECEMDIWKGTALNWDCLWEKYNHIWIVQKSGES